MGFWDWFLGPRRFTVTYPLVTVNGNLTPVELDALSILRPVPEGQTMLACALLVRDQMPPRTVLHFGADLAITKRQGAAIAHELNHVLSQIHSVPDETHTVDGGRLA